LPGQVDVAHDDGADVAREVDDAVLPEAERVAWQFAVDRRAVAERCVRDHLALTLTAGRDRDHLEAVGVEAVEHAARADHGGREGADVGCGSDVREDTVPAHA
jgi:hypothetical protein